MSVIVSFAVGLIFSIGLGISGMTQPERVIGFLDLFGSWDPTLMFVMAGAAGVYTIFFRLLRGQAPIFARSYELPTRRDIDSRLVVGAVLFGVGWGLAGFCPGPALTSLASGATEVIIFVAAMVSGMVLFRFYESLRGQANKRAASLAADA